ncbi:hypothetical protein B0A49_13650 [Cryomyces minteri]|uniref:Uncharacterized protein n=1 Tax=Cryomyces minteri TaxID=331657 RepID=A0A4U0U9E8_9PEZI|nr:hypothetical protein B0A49_13650 [Cryomyces minteri]
MRYLAGVFPSIDVKKQRLRCAGHIINLVVKAILFGKGVSRFQKALAGAGDAEEFRMWRERGEQRMQEFKRCQRDVAPDELMKYYNLIKDGGIRWNSTLAMISVVNSPSNPD